MKSLNGLFYFCCLSILLNSCIRKEITNGPFFGNGFHNGWAEQHSVVIWTRLTINPEMNVTGEKFLPISNKMHQTLRRSIDEKQIYNALIPEGYSINDMEGACPGVFGELKLIYYPKKHRDKKIEIDWMEVDSIKNFTKQWILENLISNSIYKVEILARKNEKSFVSDTIYGEFKTPPEENITKDINFCVVTCHDYIRRDDSLGGHKIYPSMILNSPDFFVHTGDIEYYDKPDPYALTEDLMRLKWDRLFALPFQRDFYSKVTSYFMKDDHDVLSDDVFPGKTYGTVDFDRGLKIFDEEQFPMNKTRYKTVRWGKDLQIWMLEGRNYRSKNTLPDGPDKTILGKEQKEWLFNTINESDATFKIIISPTPILGPDRKNKNDNHSNDGFQHEGDELRSFINQHDNIFICNGDRHWQYVTHWENTNLWEFGCGAGSDVHAGGWSQNNFLPEHRFLRVKGGYLLGNVYREKNMVVLKFQHCDVDGNVKHEELFKNDIK